MITIRKNIDLREMTTFGIKAECGRLVEFSDPKADLPMLDRQSVLDNALIIGGGSNLLFTSNADKLTIIHPTAQTIDIFSHDDQSVLVKVDAGVVLDELCLMMAQQGLWGTENLSGIPGHIGGAAVQNVGAYGTEFKDVVKSVTCYSRSQHKFITLSNEECSYGYRDSIFKHQPADELLIVCSVILQLSITASPNLTYKGLKTALETIQGNNNSNNELSTMLIRQTVIDLRNSKLPSPSSAGSAGSFFKNPVICREELSRLETRWSNNPANKDNLSPLPYHLQADGKAKLSAAWLIDKAGCKPLTNGGAALWQQQPLVIVNQTGRATGSDVVGLEKMVINQVQDVFGITLTPEVIHV